MCIHGCLNPFAQAYNCNSNTAKLNNITDDKLQIICPYLSYELVLLKDEQLPFSCILVATEYTKKDFYNFEL